MPVVFTFFVEQLPASEMLADDTLVINLLDEVVVNDNFFAVDNYEVLVIEGVGEVRIREIIGPQDGSLTTDRIIIIVDRPAHGTHYRLSATGLTGLTGALIGGSGDFIGRRTKTQALLNSLPSHFDRRPKSVIRQMLTAIGEADEAIGGSRSDSFV